MKWRGIDTGPDWIHAVVSREWLGKWSVVQTPDDGYQPLIYKVDLSKAFQRVAIEASQQIAIEASQQKFYVLEQHAASIATNVRHYQDDILVSAPDHTVAARRTNPLISHLQLHNLSIGAKTESLDESVVKG